MNNSQYILLSKETGLLRQLGVVSNNVANVNTTGFKSDNMIYQNFSAKLDTPEHKPKSVDYSNDIGTYTDYSAGPIEETNNPLDFAITGPGYFIVQSPLGERYSRAGSFHIDGNGQLVNPQGYPILGADRQPIVFQQGDRDILAHSNGSITARQDGSPTADDRGQIGIVTFANTSVLTKYPNSLLGGAEGQIPEDGSFKISQGVLEKSNVDSVTELSHLIELNRNSAGISTAISSIHSLELKALDTINKQ